jgi:hypothetical protein
MDRSTKTFLVVAGLILLSGLVILGVIYGVTQIVRQTAEDALSPITNSNAALGTRVSEVLHPTPTVIPDPVTIIHEIRSLARLETIQYTIEKVITAEQGQGNLSFLFGDKLLFVGRSPGLTWRGCDQMICGSKIMFFSSACLRRRSSW